MATPTSSRGRRAPAPLDAVELAAWRAVVENAEFLIASIDGDLAATGVSLGEYQVLVFLSEAPDRRMRMVDLAAKLRLSPSGLTRRIDGLVRNGYVQRVPCEEDRRVMLAVLAPAGYEKLLECYPVHLASVRARFVEQVQPGGLGAIAAAFDAMGQALQDAP